MEKFNIENYSTKIYLMLFNTNKLCISQISLENFFKQYEISYECLGSYIKKGNTKLNKFNEIMKTLYENDLITGKKIVKIYKDLWFKYDFCEFEGVKNNYFLKTNINYIIEENKIFLNQIMDSINRNIKINLPSHGEKIYNFNFEKLIELFEILFIYPELLPLKECLLIFIKSLERSMKIKDKRNNENIPLLKIGNINDNNIFNVDFLINFLVLLSKYMSFKYCQHYKKLLDESNSLTYLLWYIYFCIEKHINEKEGNFYSEFVENLSKNPYLIISK